MSDTVAPAEAVEQTLARQEPALAAKPARGRLKSPEALASAEAALAAAQAAVNEAEADEAAEPVVAEATPTAPATATTSPAVILPKSVKLLRPYGFYEGGTNSHWAAGQVVTSAADIATLTARGAPVSASE